MYKYWWNGTYIRGVFSVKNHITHLQEKSKMEVEVGVGEGGKFMCESITDSILHTARNTLQNIAFQNIPNFLFHNNSYSNTLHLMTFDLVVTYRIK